MMQHMVAPDPKLAFSLRLRDALTADGIEIKRGHVAVVARIFNVSGETARKWLSGQSIPDTKRLPEIAKRLKVSALWLLSGQGPMKMIDSYKTREEFFSGPPQHKLSEGRRFIRLINQMAPILEAASDNLRNAIEGLLICYQENPGEAERIAKAINALLNNTPSK